MIHEFYVLPVIIAYFFQAVRKLLPLAKQLFEATETAGYRVTTSINNSGIWQDEFYQPDMEKIVWHLVGKKRSGAPVGAGILNELLTKSPKIIIIKFRQNFRISGYPVLIIVPAAQPFE